MRYRRVREPRAEQEGTARSVRARGYANIRRRAADEYALSARRRERARGAPLVRVARRRVTA